MKSRTERRLSSVSAAWRNPRGSRRPPPRAVRFASALVQCALCFGIAGCGRGDRVPARPSPASPPAHPAMREDLSAAAARLGGESAERPFLERLGEYGLVAEVPSGWKESASRSPMRLATFILERAEGDPADAELSVVAALGTEEANIERWRSQFEGSPEAVVASRESGPLRISVAELAGTYIADRDPQPRSRLWGAIVRIEGRRELLFFKCWGPARTVEKWKSSLERLLASLSPKP